MNPDKQLTEVAKKLLEETMEEYAVTASRLGATSSDTYRTYCFEMMAQALAVMGSTVSMGVLSKQDAAAFARLSVEAACEAWWTS